MSQQASGDGEDFLILYYMVLLDYSCGLV
ncbi:BnaC03g24430D [Brassica napus]|uniref:BnaC03g24430D protein n=1 Tax=Brassica napus TaxID=3708 RepID=A0A078I330_BRANA|nr:BnaC03g24430D [Brassica napus]